MSEAKQKGIKKPWGSWAGASLCDSKAPGVDFPCEKLTKEELSKLSGPVKTYHISELEDEK